MTTCDATGIKLTLRFFHSIKHPRVVKGLTKTGSVRLLLAMTEISVCRKTPDDRFSQEWHLLVERVLEIL